MKTPFIKALKNQYPTATIDLIAGNSYGAEHILGNSNLINNTIIVKEDQLELQKKLQAEFNYDFAFLAFDAAPPFLPKFLKQSNTKKLVRHYLPNKNPIKNLKRKLHKKTIWVPLLPDVHEIELNINLLKVLKHNAFEYDSNTFVNHKANDEVLQRYEIQQPYILIQPGAANGTDPTKVWAINNYIQLIEQLLNHYGHPIVLVGDKGDYKDSIAPLMHHFQNDKRIINTASKTSIEDLKNLIYYSSSIICQDSGVMHIADALEKKLIALFGPSDFNRVRPKRKSSITLKSHTKYFNIKHFFKPFTVKNLKKGESANYPMSDITVSAVFKAVNNIYKSD